MKYIDKSGPESLIGKAILEEWVATNAATIQNLSLQGKTSDLWNTFDKRLIKEYLYIEQNGLCCYCGRLLVNQVHHIVMEHFKLKSLDQQNQYPNMFSYDNLMLSCHGNKHHVYEVQNGDTWQSISLKPECRFTGNKLDELRKWNPDNTLRQENGEPKVGELLIVGANTNGKDTLHCDNFRGKLPLNINPTQDVNCIDRFIYTVNSLNENGTERGRVIHKTGDGQAEEAIKNLHLNAPILLEDREAIVKEAIQLAGEISAEIEAFEPTNRQQIIDIANRYLSGIKGFYVVYRAYFKDDFPELFQD